LGERLITRDRGINLENAINARAGRIEDLGVVPPASPSWPFDFGFGALPSAVAVAARARTLCISGSDVLGS
jgi:hypothetical protein